MGEGFASLDEDGCVPVAAEELLELLVADAREHAGVRNLVAVQMQNRQHGAIGCRIEKLVRMPARCQRSGFGLAVTDDGRHDELGIVERGAVGVTEGVAELAAFVNRAWRLGRDVTRNAARKGELLEQLLHPFLVLRHVRVRLRVRSLEPRVRDDARSAVPRTDHVDHVEVALP